MASLVYLCARPQSGAAAAEYESFRTAMRLGEEELARWNLVNDELPQDFAVRWRGAVVGGSPFNVSDPESAKTDTQRRVESDLARLARAAAAGETAALFTCYGIGVASRALGGEVSRAYPEDTGPTTIELTDAGRADPIFGALAQRFTALTAHKEGTSRLPDGAVLLASGGGCPGEGRPEQGSPEQGSPEQGCPVQAYRVGDRLYAAQFHPEPTARAFTQRMAVYRDDGYFAASDYDTIAARVFAASLSEPPRILRAFARAF
ncbi:MAG: GMP synthase [Microbacterium sp.]